MTNSTHALDVARIRQDFPILKQTVNGKPLVYLDNAATSQKPQSVIDALVNYYSTENSNVHRGVHTLSQLATDEYEAARSKIRQFINAAEDHEIIYVRGTTEGINLVAQTYGRQNVGPGDEIIISTMEHHSNIVPWQILCQEKDAQLKIIPINDAGELLIDEYEKLLGPRTKLVSIVHFSTGVGQHFVKLGEHSFSFGDGHALDSLGQHGSRCLGNGTAGPLESNVANNVIVHFQVQGVLITAQRIVAVGVEGGIVQLAVIAGLAVVVQQNFLVQVG